MHDPLADIEADFAGLIAQPWLVLAYHEDTAFQICDNSSLASQEAPESTTSPTTLLPRPAPLPSISTASMRRRDVTPAGLDTAAQAQAIYARRELQKALDYGFALLDALDLPPLALDVIDDAIAHLDALDAADEDLEPYLAGYSADLFYDPRGEAEDADSLEIFGEGDFYEDAEDDDPAEETSLETAGRGFVRAGADDTEDDDPAERDEEHGSEDEAYPWRFDPASVAFAAKVAHV